MMTTYKAVLHGDTIEWRENVPPQVSMGQAVDVHVTVLDQIPVADNRGQRMAESLSKLAQSGAFADVDGQEWEREIRDAKALVGLTEKQQQELDDRLAAYIVIPTAARHGRKSRRVFKVPRLKPLC